MNKAIIRVEVEIGTSEPENVFHTGDRFRSWPGLALATIEGIETYQGWPNRETWAANLFLSNTQVIYDDCRRIARDSQFDRWTTAQVLRAYVDQQIWEAAGEVHPFRGFEREVGSLWRVDWDLIAEAFLEEVRASV